MLWVSMPMVTAAASGIVQNSKGAFHGNIYLKNACVMDENSLSFLIVDCLGF